PESVASPDLVVRDAMQQLPAKQRAAVALFYLEDRPVAEVADLLGISVSTCTVHLTRARRRLATLLRGDESHPDASHHPSPSASGSVPSSTSSSLDGTWRSVLTTRDLERRGFGSDQIRRLQARDGWSTRQVNEIRIAGSRWMLSQAADGQKLGATCDFGRMSS